LYRFRATFQFKVRETVKRLIKEGVEKVDLAAIFKHGYFTNLTEIYGCLRILKQLGIVDEEGKINVERAEEFIKGQT
jgi:hypothetical protein